VANLPTDWQDKLLDEFEREKHTRSQIRGRVKEVKSFLAQGWTPQQLDKKARVEAGESVLANMADDGHGRAKDEALINWADAEDLFVRIDRQSVWGNPFILDEDGDRETVIENYRWYLGRKPSLLNRIDQLNGKVLGCWCCPEACHGDVLLHAINQEGCGHGNA
jgi:hypothetical protein